MATSSRSTPGSSAVPGSPFWKRGRNCCPLALAALYLEYLPGMDLLVLHLPDRELHTGVEPSRHVIPGNAAQQHDVVD